ncbi:MAG: hypothetical protein VKO44_06790 [Cyanobacteriota bacterium]|nr:hypothetical protein [Cyanobacteriota bacterium]
MTQPTMLHALAFVLSLEASLPEGDCDWPALVEAQRQGLRSGTQLRLFRVPEDSTTSLSSLLDARALSATGASPFAPAKPSPLICDALVPVIDPRRLWLGVYQVSGSALEPTLGLPGWELRVERVHCLDRYPLQEAANETCWFYPTDNGRYLAWENRRLIHTLPGHLPDRPPQESPLPYTHGDVHLLWALMADDLALTCVGLTWRRQRIEWPLLSEKQEDLSTWTEFQVDAMAESSYQELNSATLFPADAGEG